jgi:hypothetical protein
MGFKNSQDRMKAMRGDPRGMSPAPITGQSASTNPIIRSVPKSVLKTADPNAESTNPIMKSLQRNKQARSVLGKQRLGD